MLSQVLTVIVQTADEFAELVLSALTEVPDLVFGVAVAVLGWLLRCWGGCCDVGMAVAVLWLANAVFGWLLWC